MKRLIFWVPLALVLLLGAVVTATLLRPADRAQQSRLVGRPVPAFFAPPLQPGRPGLARELARMNLTLNAYTQWYWKTDLHNLFNFLSLRADAHAQYEIRVYADAMMASAEAWVPIAASAFRDYRLGAVTLSAQMLGILRRMLAGEAVDQAASGLSKREWRELMETLGRAG